MSTNRRYLTSPFQNYVTARPCNDWLISSDRAILHQSRSRFIILEARFFFFFRLFVFCFVFSCSWIAYEIWYGQKNNETKVWQKGNEQFHTLFNWFEKEAKYVLFYLTTGVYRGGGGGPGGRLSSYPPPPLFLVGGWPVQIYPPHTHISKIR